MENIIHQNNIYTDTRYINLMLKQSENTITIHNKPIS